MLHVDAFVLQWLYSTTRTNNFSSLISHMAIRTFQFSLWSCSWADKSLLLLLGSAEVVTKRPKWSKSSSGYWLRNHGDLSIICWVSEWELRPRDTSHLRPVGRPRNWKEHYFRISFRKIGLSSSNVFICLNYIGHECSTIQAHFTSLLSKIWSVMDLITYVLTTVDTSKLRTVSVMKFL